MLTRVPRKILWLAAFGGAVIVGTKLLSALGSRAERS